MASLSSAVLALLGQVQPHAVGRAQETIKAFIGLAVIIVLPTAMVYWARKRFRP